MKKIEKIFAFIVFICMTFSTNADLEKFNVLKILFIIFVWPLFYCLWNMFFHRMSAREIIPEYSSELENVFHIVGNIIKKLYDWMIIFVEAVKNMIIEIANKIKKANQKRTVEIKAKAMCEDMKKYEQEQINKKSKK